jgi:hypothetical protein
MKPGAEEAVMGPYYPKGHYTTKEDFEMKKDDVTMATGQGKTMTLTMQTLPNSRGYQYCELVFDYGDKGYDIYSTSPLARARLDWWDKLDLEALAKEFGAQSVHKNGPQWWSMDEVGVMASAPVQVAGVDMVFGAHLPPGTLSTPKYKVFSPAKTQNLLWKAGKPVYQLVDPDGHIYVLQGHKVPENSLATLGERFQQLPDGWVVSLYRVHSLFGRTKAFVLSRIRLRKLACTRYRDTTGFRTRQLYAPSSSSKALASCRSAVSKPSVNQP